MLYQSQELLASRSASAAYELSRTTTCEPCQQDEERDCFGVDIGLGDGTPVAGVPAPVVSSVEPNLAGTQTIATYWPCRQFAP